MVGANYMGGKRYTAPVTSQLQFVELNGMYSRNAAKARSRDKTGRVQKDFFVRKRLSILSKGLAAAPCPQEVTPTTCASINLEHARKATSAQRDTGKTDLTLHSTDSVSVSRKRKRGQSNIETSSSSPCSKVSVKTGSSATKSTRSKLLQQLDLMERE